VKVWITKYALTSGVFVADADPYAASADGTAVCARDRYHTLFRKPDWHDNQEATSARVKTMIGARRKALAKENAKLDGIDIALAAGTLPMMKPWIG
jgi:hypothetical protein